MILVRRILASLLIWGAGTFSLAAQNTNQFELRDGDRVVLLGDTLIEREQRYGHIEYLFTTHWPDRNITFRNLGWSADTPEGISRAGFDPDEKGWHHLTNQIAAVKPTVVFLGYGMASSFAGETGVTNFIAGINRVIDTVQQIVGKEPVRWLILSPIAHERLPPPLPDPEPHNRQLALYTEALKDIAGQRQAHFVSLFEHLNQSMFKNVGRLTDNGIHLSDYGYRRAAEAIGMNLNLEPHIWRLGVTLDGRLREGGFGNKVLEFVKTNDYVKFVAVEEQLVNPLFAGNATNFPLATPDNRLQIHGLRQGTYDIVIDNKPWKRVTDGDLLRGGYAMSFGPASEQAEELRQTILKKNELFFHRWRPQNNTYLLLFRKHEQGQNAGEIPKFDPLVQEQEAKIAKLRVPVPHVYEVIYNTNAFVGITESARRASPPVTDKPQTPFRPQPVPVFEVQPGFEVSLFAENPQLAKPIQMNFDPQGRLWVASSSVYPQIAPGQEADDKILILEDTNRDGRADRTTVFADNLLIPTGVEPGDGGAYVGQSTELLHLKDTDGDGIADERRIVLSGFGTEDTHHTLHTLRWGYDGQLYMNQSIYIHSHLETPHGVVRLRSGGILNLRPSTMKCDIFMKGLINGWGHHYDLYGQSFATDGAGGAPPNGIFYVVPGAMYAAYENARRIMGSISPGSYPKFCGLEVVYSQHFPLEWQGNMITCDFRAHRIVRFAVDEQKSAYVTRQMPDLLRTTNVSFRPIDVKIGPDGALYIADWSNPIINHGEVDFRDPRRDRVHGRIWRVTAKGRELVNKPNFHQPGNTELFRFLTSSNEFIRQQTRRVLAERGESIRKDLEEWVNLQAGNERAQLEALWLYQSLSRTNLPVPLLHRLLDARDGRVRAAAIRVVSDWHSDLWSPVDLLSAQVAHPFARVRLEAVRALARIPGWRSAELVLSALDHPMDEFLDYAVWLSINELAEPWIKAVESGLWKIEGREKQLEFGLKAIPSAQASRVLSKLIATRPLSSGNMIELIGQAGGSKELEQLFSEAGNLDTARALGALAEAARLRGAKPERDLERISRFLGASDNNVRQAAIRLAGSWKVSAVIPEIFKAVNDPELRGIAFDALRDIGNKGDVVARLRELAAKGDLQIRRPAAATLAGIDLAAAVPLVMDVLREAPTEEEALALWRDVLTVRGAGGALARAVPKASLPGPAMKAGLRAAREGARSEADLVIALSPSGQLQELTRAEIEQISRRVKDGDPARGEQIYRRKELGCVTCHAIGGAGGKVGPDMTSIGASSPVDYLVESLFMPESKIKEGYNSVLVSTRDNDEFSGVLVREDADQVVLRDATNKEMSVPKKNIASRKVGGSLMPAGLLEALSPGERHDLLRFLSELGKPGPYDASKQNVARVWHVSLNDDGKVESWTKVLTTVDGMLQKRDLESELALANRREPFFAVARFQTSRHGTIKLTLDGVQTPKASLDGKPVGGNTDLVAELPPGVHTFKLKLDAAGLSDAIRLQISDGAFLVD